MHKASGHKQGSLPTSASGFTLLELLVAIVLLGILVAVAAPSVVRSFSAHSVDREARQLHSWLATARSRAVAEQRDYRFELKSDGSYEIKHVDAGVWVVDGGSEVADGMTATISGATSGTIDFQSHGRVDSPETIEVHDGVHDRKINILASGLMRWVSGQK
jgi:prepilin-type N-terminal cleavage/methylation domain-containing protein